VGRELVDDMFTKDKFKCKVMHLRLVNVNFILCFYKIIVVCENKGDIKVRRSGSWGCN